MNEWEICIDEWAKRVQELNVQLQARDATIAETTIERNLLIKQLELERSTTYRCMTDWNTAKNEVVFQREQLAARDAMIGALESNLKLLSDGHHTACAPSGYMDSDGVPHPPSCHPDCFLQNAEIADAQITEQRATIARLEHELATLRTAQQGMREALKEVPRYVMASLSETPNVVVRADGIRREFNAPWLVTILELAKAQQALDGGEKPANS